MINDVEEKKMNELIKWRMNEKKWKNKEWEL